MFCPFSGGKISGGSTGSINEMSGGQKNGGGRYSQVKVGGGSNGHHGMKVSVNGGQGGRYGFQVSGSNNGGKGSHSQVQVGGSSTGGNGMIGGMGGGRFGFQTGGISSGGRGHGQVKGNGGNGEMKVGGASMTSSTQGGSFSWGTGGSHGGKVDDGMSRNNGNGGGVMTYDGKRLDGNDGGDGSVGNGVVNEHRVGNFGNGVVNEQGVGGNGDGNSLHNGPTDATGLDPHHSDGTITSENGNVSLHGESSTSPDENMFHPNTDGAGNSVGKNAGMNSDSIDREQNSGNSETVNDGHQDIGSTSFHNSGNGVSKLHDSANDDGSDSARLHSMNDVRNSENNEASHQNVDNTSTFTPTVGARISGDVDSGAMIHDGARNDGNQVGGINSQNGDSIDVAGNSGRDETTSNGQQGVGNTVMRIPSKIGGSEQIINGETGNGTGIGDGGSQEESKSGVGEDIGYTGGGNMVGNSQEGNGNEVRLGDGNKMDESGGGSDGEIIRTGSTAQVASINGTGEPLSHTVATDNDNLEDSGGVGNMDRNTNKGRIQGMASFDHPRDIVNNNRNLDSIRLNDEVVTNNQPPGIWVLRKNNISRQTGVNNGSMVIMQGNINGTHAHKGVRKWGKKDNVARHHGTVDSSNVGSKERLNITREDKSYSSVFQGNMNRHKKDITGHHRKIQVRGRRRRHGKTKRENFKDNIYTSQDNS